MANQRAYKAQCNGNDFVILIKGDLLEDLTKANIQTIAIEIRGSAPMGYY